MGRPPKKVSQLRRNRMVLLFTDDEMQQIEDHIAREGFEGHNHLGREAILALIESKNPVQTGGDDGEKQ